jgi:hypothetical protein
MPYTYCGINTSTTNYTPITWVSGTATSSNVIYPQNWQWQPSYSYTTTTYQTTGDIWQQWVNTTYGTASGLYRPYVSTAADREAQEKRDRERVAARARAQVLLGEFLSEDQKVELEHHGRFHVTGSRGRRYCIRASGQSGNVDLLKPDGSVQARLCCHPREYLPDGDAWLMQMIEIRHDEDHFLRTSNVHLGSLPVAA